MRQVARSLAVRSNQDRFEEKWEEDPAGHWMWTAGQGHGYGSFGFRTEDGRGVSITAPRAAWRIYRGPIPHGAQVLHRCGVKLCVYPFGDDHLYLGTPLENGHDRVRLGEQVRGESHPAARLTEAQVDEIRALDLPSPATAARYGVSPGLIRQIRLGQVW